jgi:hypothetical protein
MQLAVAAALERAAASAGGVYGCRMARDTLSGYKPRCGFFLNSF